MVLTLARITCPSLCSACNFAPIFKIWDRAFGTLNDTEPFWWKTDRKAKELSPAG